jgi:D-sedoheptulose 7-phosphate isomerase
MSAFFDSEFEEHLAVAAACRSALAGPFERVVQICLESIKTEGKLLFFGNGGSAADAQHLAAELTVRYRQNRVPIAGLALTTDTSVLTAAGNDLGFDTVFARQVEALGRRGDVGIGISTSGRSPNVIAAFEACRRKGLHTILFTGGSNPAVVSQVDACLAVPSVTTARIQEMHITLGQMLCGELERRLGLVPG